MCVCLGLTPWLLGLSDSRYGSGEAGFEFSSRGRLLFQNSPTISRRSGFGLLKLRQEQYYESYAEEMVDMGVKRREGATERMSRHCKCRGSRFLLQLVLVLLVAECSDHVCLAQSLNDAKAYLDNVENEVMRVAAQATENFVNTCGTLSSPFSTGPYHIFVMWKSVLGHCFSSICQLDASETGLSFGSLFGLFFYNLLLSIGWSSDYWSTITISVWQWQVWWNRVEALALDSHANLWKETSSCWHARMLPWILRVVIQMATWDAHSCESCFLGVSSGMDSYCQKS